MKNFEPFILPIILLILGIVVIKKFGSGIGTLFKPFSEGIDPVGQEKDFKVTVDKATPEQLDKWKYGFNPDNWKDKENLISEDKAKDYAIQIKDSIGFISEDEERILGIIREIPNLNSLSYVTHFYNTMFKSDLSTVLEKAFGGWIDYKKYGIKLNDLIFTKTK